uniref:CMP/dCMP-type deaminase domain-containing protein n=1 Tax=Chromera velia CCMP2878 TaxID=1169474 RepID=A0A0G4G6S1_9ALVE|eukprot:Cvel_4220.t1-p1 / transcript=Cvel_4220.t1 / gene=Cvel_4220 / organism=Chromera_velia_CCMP2878 / gene_product=hypothetical protein / transcript_product=hypothetical protein / location=Cvel_scaffold182:83023-83760(+) / protein_length=246 / sequence_SO=supercontig / SO=protein_coding / is_pseudo=false
MLICPHTTKASLVALGIFGAGAAVTAAAFHLIKRRGSARLSHGTPLPPLTASVSELRRMLAVIETEILPRTKKQVETAGDKVFGAAVLDESFKTVLAETNHETLCPLYHGEVYTIQQWAGIKTKKPSARDSIFLSTHEPCCMCISSIVWSGFRKCFYLFPYETTRDQGIPHDLKIMHELWRVERYAERNEFCSTAGLLSLIEDLQEGPEKKELQETARRITQTYDELSKKYHGEKGANAKNTLAFH